MRDTVWAGHVQKMVNDDGVPKGMKVILEEQCINTERMKADDMRTILSFHDDIANEKRIVEKLIADKGHKCLFLPKFHCELSPIESLGTGEGLFSCTHQLYVGLRSIREPGSRFHP